MLQTAQLDDVVVIVVVVIVAVDDGVPMRSVTAVDNFLLLVQRWLSELCAEVV